MNPLRALGGLNRFRRGLTKHVTRVGRQEKDHERQDGRCDGVVRLVKTHDERCVESDDERWRDGTRVVTTDVTKDVTKDVTTDVTRGATRDVTRTRDVARDGTAKTCEKRLGECRDQRRERRRDARGDDAR